MLARRLGALSFLALLAAGIAAPGCGADDEAPSAAHLELKPTTRVLDADALGRITEVSPDVATIGFGSTSAAIAAIAQGDVILGGIGPKTPNGVLRRVTAVTKTGAGVTLTTTRASLTDAIARGTFAVPETPLSAASARAELAEGVHARTISPGALVPRAGGTLEQDFTLAVDRWEVAKGIEASGSLGFGLGAGLSVSIDGTSVNGTLTLHGSESATLDLFAKYQKAFGKRHDLAAYYFPPIPIPGVPLVIVLKLAVDVGAKGSVSSAMTWSGRQNADVSLGASVGTGGLTPIKDGSASASSDPPVIGAAAEVHGLVGLRLEASINAPVGEAAIWVGVDGDLALTGDATADPCWRLAVGLDGRLGASAGLLGITLASEEVTPHLDDDEIASGACSALPPVAPWAASLAPTGYDTAPSLALFPDQTFVVSANTEGSTAYLARLDPSGASLWERSYAETTVIDDVIAAEDGTAWIGGRLGTTVSVAHLDADGAPLSAARLVAGSDAALYGVHYAPAPDGGVLLGGTYAVSQGFAAKLDANGALVWARVYPGIGTPYAIAATKDGGAVLFGSVPIAGGAKSSLARVGADGSLVFARSYGEGRFFGGTSLTDGSVLATGATASTGEATVVRAGADGTPIYAFAYGDSNKAVPLRGNSASERADGVIVVGRRDFGSGADGWAMQIAPDGTLGWSRTYGGPAEDDLLHVRTTKDGGALAVGTTYSFGKTVHAFVNRLPPLGALDYGAAGAQQTNVNGVKGALPGSTVDLPTTAMPLDMTITATPLADWTGASTAAPRTVLAP